MSKRYDRASFASALTVAYHISRERGKPMYIYATAYGLTVEDTPPVFRQNHSVVKPDGTHTLRMPNMPGDGYIDVANHIVDTH